MLAIPFRPSAVAAPSGYVPKEALPSHGKPVELIANLLRRSTGALVTISRRLFGAGVFLGLSARHTCIDVAPIATFRLWAARVKLVPEHQ